MPDERAKIEDADDDIKAEADACMRRIKKRKEAEEKKQKKKQSIFRSSTKYA